MLRPDDALGTIQSEVRPTIVGFETPTTLALLLRPSDDVQVVVDWAGGAVDLRGAVSLPENLASVPPAPAIDAVFELHGVMRARPPTIDVDGQGVIECAGLEGTPLELAATVADADGDIQGVTWLGDSGAVAYGNPANIVAPLGETHYTGVVVDAHQKLAAESFSVRVEDTTPPFIRDFANHGPVCLWSPRHDYVVLRIGAELTAVVEDTCDVTPSVALVAARSNQPDDGAGDGHTGNDVVLFPDRVCLRAERAGGDPDGRVYRVELRAMDTTGNASRLGFEVRVAHDQSDHDCPTLDAALFVDDGDPLCDPAFAEVASEGEGEAEEEGEATASGCATGVVAPLPSLLLLLLLSRRRPRLLLPLLPLLLLGLASCNEAPAKDAAACVADVWFQPERVALSCPAGVCAECDVEDCQQRNFQWLRDDGTALSGFVMISRSAGTFSSGGPPPESTWTLTGETLELGGQSGKLECSNDAMVWDGRNFVRAGSTAEEQFAGAYAARDEDGSWRGQPLSLE